MAIVLDEPEAGACIAALEAEGEILISAGTVAEALIVSAAPEFRHGSSEHHRPTRVWDRGCDTGRRATHRRAYQRWGRGLHLAALNFGNCFAYEVTTEHACRLLYGGDDFAKTGIEGVL